MKKVLLIGNGAREHVIAETLKRSPQEVELIAYASSVNPGIEKLASVYEVGDLMDFENIEKFAEKIKPDFAVVGPDDPIGAGCADVLLDIGVHSMAPLKVVAQLESSKSFTRDLLKKYDVPGNPKFKVFFESKGIEEFIDELEGEYVVKADGLMGGKGVKVSGEHIYSNDEGVKFASDCIEKFGRVVVEEKLVGQEFSLMCFSDGVNIVDMPAVQDHKRAYVGDKGPNTGGMGSYSDANHSLPFLKQEDIDAAHEMTVKTAEALFKETGCYFKGIMYGGFIVTKNGVKLIEYNARFGDPEAMNVLPILKSDFVEICEGVINGNLNEVNVEFENKATVCKYIVPDGYPTDPVKGEKIEIADYPSEVKLYYASVNQKDDGLYMSSSRAVAFVGIADTIDEAEKLAQSALGSVKGPVFFREDIGTKELVQKRIDMMKEIRGE